MSEWNLSVRLTGRGSSLARTLRDTAADARNASNEINALRRNLSLLRTEASNDIRVRLDVDADHLRSDVSAALTSAGAGQGLAVDLRLGNAMQLRREVEAAVRWAAWGHRIEIPIGLTDAMQLRRDVTAAVRWAQDNQRIRVRVDADTSALRGLGGSGSSGGGLDIGLAGLLPIATAAIPLLAGLSTGLGPLTAGFTAGGTAAAAFGIAIAGQIGPLSEVADAQTKYEEAVREHGRASAEAMQAQLKYQQILAELPPEAQQAAMALARLKQNFGDWSDEMAGFTMAPLTKGITVLDQLIPRLTPHVKSASTQLDRLVTIAGGAISTPGFDAMADKFADFTDKQLAEMTDGVIHFLRVLSEGGAFQDGPIAEFMAYARQNGPAAREALSAISEAVVTLLRAAAEAGPTMLTLVTAAARLVAALPPELVGIILQVATALKLLQLSGAGFAALAAGMGRVRTSIAALGTTAATAGGGLAGLRAAFLSLGLAAKASIIVAGIGALAYAVSELADIGKSAPPDVDRLTTSLGKLGQTGKATGYVADQFGKDFGKLKDQIDKVINPSVAESINNWGADITGGLLDAGDATEEFTGSMEVIDQSLTDLVKGGKPELAKAALENMLRGMSPEQVKKFREELDGYDSVIADLAFEADLTAQSMGLFGEASQATSAKLDAQKQSADGLRQAIVALNDVNRAAGSAMSAFEQSLDDTTKAIKEHAGALKWRDGELDLGTQKARDAEKVLSSLAANTDAAATAAREQGKSWEHVNGIYDEGRAAFIKAADAMGLTREQAELLAASYLNIPDKKELSVEMRTEDAISGLDAVIAAIEETPDAKSVTVKALTADAQSMLRGLGFQVTELKDGSFKVTASTATAEASLADVQKMRDGLSDKSITIDARTQDTINSLQGVQDKVAATKGKTITMKAPTSEARHQLELLGFRIRDTKGKNVEITVPTGAQRTNVAALASAIAGLRDKSVTITTNYVVTGSQARRSGAHGSQLANARGGVWDYYADGGIRTPRVHKFAAGAENHVAQIAPAGSWRVWAEPETGGEGYVPFARSKRPRSRAITEEIVRRLGGDPDGIQWNANGSITAFAGGGFSYTPPGTMKSATDVMSSYTSAHQPISKEDYNKKLRARANAVDSLRAAEAKLAQVRKGKHTHAQLVAAENQVAKARRTLATATEAARKAEARYKKTFSLSDWQKTLSGAVKSNAAYEANLKKIAARGGADIVDQLRGMGAEGAKLVSELAKASKKQFNDIVANLRKLGPLAKATLADYTAQLNATNKTSATFQANLAKLAGMGYGDLATQLAGQGDEAAQKIAAEAVKSKGAAAKANTAAKKNASTLTDEQLAGLVQIIAAIRKPTTGIHDVAATTGLGEDVIIAIANKAKGQISSSLGNRATRFLSDLGKANKHMAYADGGIRAGMYATRGGIIRFAEPETGGEAYLPLSPSKRRTALPVLRDVATRFGVGLTDARATRPVVIVRESSPTHVTVTAVRTGATASDIGAQVGRSIRRARRGGVAARAA